MDHTRRAPLSLRALIMDTEHLSEEDRGHIFANTFGEPSGRRCGGEPLCFQCMQRRLQSPDALSSGVSVNESSELAHCPPGILELVLVEIDQGEPHAKIITPGELVRPKTVQLGRRDFGLIQVFREELRPPQGGLDSLGGVSGPLGVGVGGSPMMSSDSQGLESGKARAHPHQPAVGQQLKKSVDYRLQHAGQERNGQTIDGPHGTDQLEHSGIAGDEREDQGEHGAEEGNRAHQNPDQAERLLGPALIRAAGAGNGIDGVSG